MNWWQALILGLVEGITEYLPVSSTGHLLLAQSWLNIPANDASNAFAICIQAGAIVAVLGLYRARVAQMIQGVLGKDPVGRSLAIHVVVGFIPAMFAGLLLEKPIKHYLFNGEEFGLQPIVAALFVGGAAILAVSWYRRRRAESNRPRVDLEALTWKMALLVGAAQCVAMWPGTSRSLVTIVGGVLVGLRLGAAVEFSFLLGLVTLGAATAHDGLKYGDVMLATYGPTTLIIGFLAAWVSAVLAVKWMVGYLQKHGLEIFGYYRIALAILVAVLIYLGHFGAVH